MVDLEYITAIKHIYFDDKMSSYQFYWADIGGDQEYHCINKDEKVLRNIRQNFIDAWKSYRQCSSEKEDNDRLKLETISLPQEHVGGPIDSLEITNTP